MRSLPILALLALTPTLTAQDLPRVGGVEPQPVRAQALRLAQALQHVGSSLPDADRKRLEALRDAAPSAQMVQTIQEVLDPYCLAMVEINPESRVKVRRGPARPQLVQGGWRSFLVKVHNAAGVTAALEAQSPNALPQFHRSSNEPRMKPENKITAGEVADRFLELVVFRQRPMRARLSGLALEYAVLQVYSRDAGRREATLSFSAGPGTEDIGFRNAVPVLFDAAPAVRVVLGVRDTDGTPTTASFVITDGVERVAPDPQRQPLQQPYRHAMALRQPWDRGQPMLMEKRLRGVYPLPARRRVREGYPDFFFQPQVYRQDGEHVDLPPGRYEFTVSRGPEYLPQQRTVVVPDGAPGSELKVDFQLKRWTHLSRLGWYSVDHHVHAAGCSHYESPEEGVRPSDMWRQALGEDLNVACVLTWGPCWYHQKANFDGQTHPLSKGDYLMRYDVEVSGFPSSHAGHLCLLNLKEDDYPGTEAIKEWPSWTLPVLQWAKAQGGVTGYAHSGWGLQPQRPTDAFPNHVIPKFDGIGANEFIVTVAHDAVDFISAGDTPLHWELNIWYHTLNAGFRTRISGETDFPCIFDDRVGMCRSYVRLDGPLEFAKVAAAIAGGRSYVSDGKTHIVDFEVGGQKLGEGTELRLDGAATVPVKARVAAMLPPEPDAVGRYIAGRPQHMPPYWDVERARIAGTRDVPVELVVNGAVAGRTTVRADGQFHDVAFRASIPRSSWVALRTTFSAHTNPVFVLVGGEPIRASRRSAEWCRAGVDACWKEKEPKIRDREKAAAKAAYDAARRLYEQRAAECFDDR